jgi:predicted nucleic acid-binding protein
VSREKSLILDANIIIRATLGIRVPDLLEKMSPFVHFFTPEICVVDAYKYLPPLLQKRGIDEQTSIASLDAVVRTVNVLDKEIYGLYQNAARKRMRKRDIDDWPIVACSLLLNCPIWTEDADFFGSGVAIWTTDRVELYLEE